MIVAILAGGFGSRLSEETIVKPKPMVEIGGKPILWHIMKTYSSFGFNEFVIALGYKGDVIKDYFINYRYHTSNITVKLSTGEITVHNSDEVEWTVHLLETGFNTETGGRVKRVAQFIGNDPFMLTYGDGVADIDIHKLLTFHNNQGKLATITAVRPPARFGEISVQDDLVIKFREKPQIGEGWINGGYFVLEPGITDYINGDESIWEQEPMERLASDGQLVAYLHNGFWQCVDTMRDVRLLDNLWQQTGAPWKKW